MIYVILVVTSAAAGLIAGFILGVSAERDRLADIMIQDITTTRRRKAGYGEPE